MKLTKANRKEIHLSVDLQAFITHCGFAEHDLEPLWEYLQQTDKPIWLYGMGDGAMKVLRAMELYGIRAKGVFASDNFAKDKIFCGFPIQKFSQVKEMYPDKDFIILLCFAAFRDDLYPVILDIAGEYELYAPDVPVVYDPDCGREDFFSPDYIKAHEKALTAVYDRLADEQSRQVFRDVLAYKCSGRVHYLDRCTTDIAEGYEGIIKPTQHDVYVDLGAYNGDTVTEFLSYSGGSCKKVIALEPDARNYKKLCAQCEMLTQTAGDTVFLPIHAGAHSHEDSITFAVGTGRSGKLQEGSVKKTVEIRVCAVDDLLCGERADVIKLDVEGAEKDALIGCAKTIAAYKPRLLVSAYHRNEDLFALPLQIMAMNPDYQLFLRHHRYIPAWETCYYFA